MKGNPKHHVNDYLKAKNSTYNFYHKIKFVHCPFLKTRVNFNSKGFWHMIYTGRNEKRELSSQKLRFTLLTKAVELIKITTTLQEYEKTQNIQYFGFIAILDSWKIKVIVKKNNDGPPFFWSVIPNWVTSRRRDKLLHKGNMEND